jgi:uncharacterized protein related to proFAR isomerase
LFTNDEKLADKIKLLETDLKNARSKIYEQQQIITTLNSQVIDSNIPLSLLKHIREKFNNIVLLGGGIDECLKEVEIALLSLDMEYETLQEFIY